MQFTRVSQWEEKINRFFERGMNGKFYFVLTLMLFISALAAGQKKVILDTDPSFDPDDAGCMAMLHTLANREECEILAIINSTNHKESSLAISAINHYYNRKAIPVGDYKGYAEKVDAPDTYDKEISEKYPRSLESWEESKDGVLLYREILASAVDNSITVVIIGTMHNFYGLLNSKGDSWSDLNGVDLVEKKVKQVVTMGGNFINGRGLDRTNWGGSEELCSYTEWSCVNEERNRMCRFVIENCKAPFVASGWEVGCGDYYNAEQGNVMTGEGLKNLSEDHIIRKSYEYHFATRVGSEKIDRHSNDQCALHYAVRGESENYRAWTGGRITLSETGICQWEKDKEWNQGYIQKKRDKDLIAAEIEELMMGHVMDEDFSAPSSVTNVVIEKRTDEHVISWDPAVDNTEGSWVIGYDIYIDDSWDKRVYGTKYLLKEPVKTVTIKSVNVSDVQSEGTSLKL